MSGPSCKTCAHRGIAYTANYWLHPDLAAEGVGYCATHPKDTETIQITPDDYVCAWHVEKNQ